jgi:hypothetical protein
MPKVQKREATRQIPEGLCQTCNHAADCGYVRSTGQPVIFCEEFSSETTRFVEEVRVEAPAPTVEDMKLWDEYKGLCVNCDQRETCAIRRPETGIWHCEEYR